MGKDKNDEQPELEQDDSGSGDEDSSEDFPDGECGLCEQQFNQQDEDCKINMSVLLCCMLLLFCLSNPGILAMIFQLWRALRVQQHWSCHVFFLCAGQPVL